MSRSFRLPFDFDFDFAAAGGAAAARLAQPVPHAPLTWGPF